MTTLAANSMYTSGMMPAHHVYNEAY